MKKLHPSDLHDAELLKRVVRYNVHLRLSPREKYNIPCPNMAQVARAVEFLNDIGRPSGRQSLVYGITGDGRQVFVNNTPTS